MKSKPINQDFKASSPKELAKAAQVRSNLYKLRITWGGNFQIFTPAVLHQVGRSFWQNVLFHLLLMTAFPQLDLRIKKIDPAWPVIHPKPVASAPAVPNGASNTKIHVNPNFVSKTVKILRFFLPLPLHHFASTGKSENTARSG